MASISTVQHTDANLLPLPITVPVLQGPGVHPPSGGSAHTHPDPHTMSAAMAAAPSESRALSQRLTERIESWFGE